MEKGLAGIPRKSLNTFPHLFILMAHTIPNELPSQPVINLGIVGHVDHGKTTLTKQLSGRWTDTHSEEIKRGITIKLGYTNFTVYHNQEKDAFRVLPEEGYEPMTKLSIVDAPGHESFMATMISGAAVMDCAILVVAADEKCPQPQTIEHLKTLEISGITNVLVVQNKIDLISREEAIENFHQIQEFLKGTIGENAPVIPVSAHHGANLSELLRAIIERFSAPERNTEKSPLMYLVRSFDINKPGIDYSKVQGGILGGSIKEGTLKKGVDIEIRPGILSKNKETYKPIYARVEGLKSDRDELDEAIPGGSVAVKTHLDPSLTKSDNLVGQIVGLKGELPEPLNELTIETNLFDKVITSREDIDVKPISPNEPLMMIVNSYASVGMATKVNQNTTSLKLKRPVMAFDGDRTVLFRRFEGKKWRIIGYGIIRVGNGQ